MPDSLSQEADILEGVGDIDAALRQPAAAVERFRVANAERRLGIVQAVR